jgi:hypothetical protein
VTTRDWRALEASDPEIARKELSGYLSSHANPFEPRSKSSGVAIGFVVGLALTMVIWYFMPDLRSALKDDIPWFANVATALMFAATFFAVAFAYIGGRWGQASDPATRSAAKSSGSFEDMLQRFERVQRELHRV